MFNKKIDKAVQLAETRIKDEIKDEISKFKSDTKHGIKELCQNLICELFDDIRDNYTEYRCWSKPRIVKTLNGEIKDRMITEAKNKFDELFDDRVKSLIAGEDFIDSVIERIKKKQINLF